MDLAELFKGVAVVIDDEVEDPKANINNIIDFIGSKNIPIVKYTKLPDDGSIDHFQNLSFLLLDWNLTGVRVEEKEAGVRMPGLADYNETENLAFIMKLKEKCFCPVFIFTNEDTSDIEKALKKQGLMTKNKPSNIFVQSKSKLKDAKTLFKKMSDWLESNPSMYVLKKWEEIYQDSKTNLFKGFYSISFFWPAIMWECFEKDGAIKSLEMRELISRNLFSRMAPCEFDNDVLSKKDDVPKNELRKVLEGERFLKEDSLYPEDVGTGDLFKEEDPANGEEENRYYLNIRAQCDLLRSNDPELFLLSGYVLKQKGNGKGKIEGVSFSNGQYLEKINHAVIAFLDNGRIIEFKFCEFSIKKWSELKENRIGRLLPPYINRTQQRYALYMQRQGLPRIPDDAIFNNSPSKENPK